MAVIPSTIQEERGTGEAMVGKAQPVIRWFEELGSGDVPVVGGKNASLGEMIRALKSEKVRVPNGFATTADAYREFLDANALMEKIRDQFDKLDRGKQPLDKTGKAIRSLFLRAEFPPAIAEAVAKPIAISAGATERRRSMWRCAAAPRRKTCRKPALPGNRKRF